MYDKDIFYIVLYSALRQMVRFPKYIPAKTGAMGLALTLGLVMGGCATNAPEKPVVKPTTKAAPVETPKQSSKPPEAEKPVKEPVAAQPNGEVPGKEPAASGEMVNVSVYTIDNQCNNFVEKTVQLPSNKALTEAVGQAMDATDYNAFKLEGYQVSVNGTMAVVDMKLAPGSERKVCIAL